MSNRNTNRNGVFSSFAAGLIGAIVGGFLVFFLLGGFSGKSNNEIATEKAPIEDTQKSADENKSENIVINTTDDSSMESAVVKKSIDSVVGITTLSQVVQQSYFGPQSGYVEGIGSGSIVSSDGYIVTNSHVVIDGDAEEINVLFNNGESTPAKLIWNDPTIDLAIVKVDVGNLKPIEIGNSDKVEVGNRVVAIGNPLGLELQSTVTSGIISGLNRTVSFDTGVQMDGLMQTDAAINAGNSGGALLNSKGELIGINTAKAGNSDGIGFAIPINIVKPVIEEVKKTGEFKSIYLGITGQSLDYLRQLSNMDLSKVGVDEGVYVISAFDDNALIKPGDVITAIDGKKVTDMGSLRKILLEYQVGESAVITIYRDGKKEDIDFTFSIDSSNVDEYKKARPEEEINPDENNRRRMNPFFNLP